MLKLYYYSGSYISHRRAAEANRAALAKCSDDLVLVDDPAQADLGILHDEPQHFPELLRQNPALAALPLIGYCVWETDLLPEAFRPGLALCRELWTCSEFSRSALLQSGKPVQVIPHIVKRLPPGKAALEKVSGLLRAGAARPEFAGLAQGTEQGPAHGSEPGADSFFFYSILDCVNPRKNLPSLLRAFYALLESLSPGNKREGATGAGPDIRLVIKQYRLNHDLSGFPRVISLTEDFSAEEISALHSLCHCYVSPHRCEAWGLGLSEAMGFGKPVIATGYSGNLTFMRPDNSFLVDYAVSHIPPEACALLPLFSPQMRWADIDEPALTRQMHKVLKLWPLPGGLARNISRICREFSPELVGAQMVQAIRGFRQRNSAEIS